MIEEVVEFIEAEEPCEEIVEFDDNVECDFEVEPEEEEELVCFDAPPSIGEFENQFARYELNYRARKIRNLTSAPPKMRSRQSVKSSSIAA